MLKSTLIELIRTLTKQELIKFEDFVRSPYFNKKDTVTKLFFEIKKYAPDFTNENLEKEKVWGKIFPGKGYNYGIMKNLIHDLGKLCESFLSEEVYKHNEMQRSIDFLSSASNRNIGNIFLNKIESVERTFKKTFETGNYDFVSDFYEKQGDLLELKASFLYLNAPQIKKRDELHQASGYLIFAFLTTCMRIFQKSVVSNLDFNHPLEKYSVYSFLKDLNENEILTNILEYAESHSPKNYPVLKFYISMYEALFNNGSVEYYEKFKIDFFKNSHSFSKAELKGLYTCLLTCLTNLKISTDVFYNEYYSILQLGFKNKIILNDDGSIHYQSFISILNFYCGAKKLEFAETFITEYKDKLPADIRDNIYFYSMAQLKFSRGNYTDSLELLINIRNEPSLLKFFIKNLQLSIYYELNDFDAFEYSFDSFKHFIRKNNLTNESRVITLTKYCNYIKLLFKLREKSDAYELANLKKEILGNKVLNKAWLLEKLDEIEKLS